MFEVEDMSWQFNHLISPQTSATTSSSLTSLTDHISKNDLKNDVTSTSERLGDILGNQYRFQAADNATLSSSAQQRNTTDSAFFQKLLQHRDLATAANSRRNIASSSSFNDIANISTGESTSTSSTTATPSTTTPINNNIANNSQISKVIADGSSLPASTATSILSSSRSSIIDHLMPDRLPAPPWSTYSIPIYTSFGADMNYPSDGEGVAASAMMCDTDNLNTNTLNCAGNTGNYNNHSIKSSSAGTNLIDRFNNNQSNSDNNVMFSNAANPHAGVLGVNNGKVLGRMRINPNNRSQDDAIGTGRTYSNVLHQSIELPEMQARLSMFDTVQTPIAVQSDPNSIIGTQSSLVTTNHHYKQSSSHQHQSSDFMSSANNTPQFYQQASCQAATNPATDFAASMTVASNQPSQAENGAIGSGYFSRPGSSYTDKCVVSNSAIGGTTSGGGGGGGGVGVGGPSKRRNKLPFLTNNYTTGADGYHSIKVDMYGSALVNSDGSERFSRKVFVGGLPPDIDEEEIKASFRRFGSLIVDWPHKAESKSYFPPKGYAFLLFHEESSVQALIDACLHEDDKLYLCVSSPTIKDKPVQIRPWRLIDADFVLDSTLALDPRKTVFVGGVPRPLKASELANIMNNLYGGVCYAGIDTDPELKYPKGAGRVAFSNHQSYIAAISARFVHLHHSEIEKRVEVKPYVLDDQFCDECQGARCSNKFAPFFCANINCLQYYCENCWTTIHSQPGREFHKPLVKEGADRPRGIPFRWC